MGESDGIQPGADDASRAAGGTGSTETAAMPLAPRRRLHPGALVDRYVVVEEQGHGGMGVVYKAFDPDLDRAVALKLLRVRAAGGSHARARLLREAQALAQLSHPNVVAVFDVGTVDDDVFLAMEYVKGPTLKHWLRDAHPPRKAILDAFLAAGRGLVAAHDAGMVHRDFKPSNVIVGEDGRVRVLDFGLARAAARDEVEPGPASGDESDSGDVERSHGSLLATPVTEYGARVGTPGYMSPEQRAGVAIDAASDQFSYCVALYEALCGVHPFGATNAEREKRMKRGSIGVPERRPGAPAWVHDVIARGLAADPAARYPSMQALLAALAADPPARRRRRIAIGAALVGPAAIAWIASRALAADPGSCEPPELALAGAWDDDIAASVRGAFERSGVPYAASTFDRVEERIGSYAESWLDMHRASCEDTHVHKRFSAEVQDLRMVCLDRRKSALAALTRQLSGDLDADAIEHAVRAVQALPGIAECADVATLQGAPALPEDPGLRAEIRSLEADIADVAALHALGRYREGLDRAGQLLAEAERVGFAPARAELLYLTAKLADMTGDVTRAETLFLQSAEAAAEAGDRDHAALSWIDLLLVVGDHQQRFDELPWLIRAADQSVRWQEVTAETRARYFAVLAGVRQRQGEYAEAQTLYESSLELLEEIGSPNLPRSLDGLATVLIEQGKLDEARPLLERAIALTVADVGPDHPRNAYFANNLGRVFEGLGELEAAREQYERAIAMWSAALGADDAHVAHPLTNLGNVDFRMERFDDAARAYDRALALFRAKYGDEHPQVGMVLINRGETLRELGRLEDARVDLERALAVLEARLGPEHVYVLRARGGLGRVYAELGRFDDAVAQFEAVVAAGDHLRDAVALGRAQLELARALWPQRAQHDRAVRLATSARDAFAAAGPAAVVELAEAQAWLAER